MKLERHKLKIEIVRVERPYTAFAEQNNNLPCLNVFFFLNTSASRQQGWERLLQFTRGHSDLVFLFLSLCELQSGKSCGHCVTRKRSIVKDTRAQKISSHSDRLAFCERHEYNDRLMTLSEVKVLKDFVY